MNNSTLDIFNNKNTANDPQYEVYKNYFTNTLDLSKRFKKLNNKKSFGLDGIFNIILQNISNDLYYKVIFNNLLNYSLFPDKWKTAKVAIQKRK